MRLNAGCKIGCQHYDVLGVDLKFIFHQLNVNPGPVSRKQPPRCSSKEHVEAVKEEVNKLKQTGRSKRSSIPSG